MNILLTGKNGFIGSNIYYQLHDKYNLKINTYLKINKNLEQEIKNSKLIIHFAGVNRTEDIEDFNLNNYELTKNICDICISNKLHIPIIYASSIKVTEKTPYGISKLKAENEILNYSNKMNVKVYILRMPNIFGKWCRPNYNSVVATFCHQIANDLEIQIHDNEETIELMYIDDLVSLIFDIIQGKHDDVQYPEIKKKYKIKLIELAELIRTFNRSRKNLNIEAFGNGLKKYLYSTYLTYLPIKKFSYPLSSSKDHRGNFSEIIKTNNSGQISIVTIYPHKTRGGHYHHTKTEKFLVIVGKVKFRNKNIINNEYIENIYTDEKLEIIETIPGWAHDITNIGKEEDKLLVWANEIFDINNSDTIINKF